MMMMVADSALYISGNPGIGKSMMGLYMMLMLKARWVHESCQGRSITPSDEFLFAYDTQPQGKAIVYHPRNKFVYLFKGNRVQTSEREWAFREELQDPETW